MSILPGSCNSEKIYIYLVKNGFTPEGACATIANLDHESGLKSNNLQDSYNKEYGSDTYYTDSINNKTYSKENFMNDKAGYGLAQWTYPTRKRGLYESTVEKGLSIDDMEGQLKYLIREIHSISTLNNILRTSKDLNDATDKFLTMYEAPLIPNYNARRATAKKYFDKYSSIDINKYDLNTNSNITSDENDSKSNIEEFGSYTVQKGDSWWSISCKLFGTGTRMKELAEINNKTINDIIYPGQILKTPLDANKVEYSNNKFVNYTVKNGDSWWSIAQNKLGDGNNMNMLAKFNGKSITDIIHPGDVIKIPVKESNSDPNNNYTK